MATVLTLWLSALLLATTAAPVPAWITPAWDGELSRLQGQTIEKNSDGAYRILDIAGEGAPWVGCVRADSGGQLSLELLGAPSSERLRLAGPLAIPRIAGPGYRVWVIGKRSEASLFATRLGILAPASAMPCPLGAALETTSDESDA